METISVSNIRKELTDRLNDADCGKPTFIEKQGAASLYCILSDQMLLSLLRHTEIQVRGEFTNRGYRLISDVFGVEVFDSSLKFAKQILEQAITTKAEAMYDEYLAAPSEKPELLPYILKVLLPRWSGGTFPYVIDVEYKEDTEKKGPNMNTIPESDLRCSFTSVDQEKGIAIMGHNENIKIPAVFEMPDFVKGLPVLTIEGTAYLDYRNAKVVVNEDDDDEDDDDAAKSFKNWRRMMSSNQFQGAFQGCSDITELILPQQLKVIRTEAFRNCSGLRRIVFPEGLKEILEGSFSRCTGLTEVALPKSLEVLDANAFEGCDSLTSIFLPNGKLLKNLSKGNIALCVAGYCRNKDGFTPENKEIYEEYMSNHIEELLEWAQDIQNIQVVSALLEFKNSKNLGFRSLLDEL